MVAKYTSLGGYIFPFGGGEFHQVKKYTGINTEIITRSGQVNTLIAEGQSVIGTEFAVFITPDQYKSTVMSVRVATPTNRKRRGITGVQVVNGKVEFTTLDALILPTRIIGASVGAQLLKLDRNKTVLSLRIPPEPRKVYSLLGTIINVLTNTNRKSILNTIIKEPKRKDGTKIGVTIVPYEYPIYSPQFLSYRVPDNYL